MENYRFKVNLKGMIEILSDHLYSSPDVYIRELLQNGVDAITARKQVDEKFTDPCIKINLVPEKSLSFYDNGSGLTEDEIHRFLAIIGESSKKDLTSGKILEEYIGRFGIGLLSYFMVTDEIVIETKSVKNNESARWIGKPDGTYEIEKIEDCPYGTTIHIECKPGKEEYFTSEKIKDLILYYGALLPFPIYFSCEDEKICLNQIQLPWEQENASDEEIMSFGQILLGEKFIDYIPLRSKHGDISGVAYVLPYSVHSTRNNKNRIFLKNMLLTEQGDSLLPEWAVFVRCIINTKNLRPTASREGFYDDDNLEQARDEIKHCIMQYLEDIAQNDIEFFKRFLHIHERVLKSMAVDEEESFQLFFPYFEFETTFGVMTGQQLLDYDGEIIYTQNMDEYTQMSQIFFAQGKLLLNLVYMYDGEMLGLAMEYYGIEATRLEASDMDSILKDVSVDEYEEGMFLTNVGNQILHQYDCKVELKRFHPATMASFYFVDQKAIYMREFQKARENSDEVFSGMLNAFANNLKKEAACTLYLNFENPLVKRMVKLTEKKDVERLIEILYAQSMLIGGYQMRNNELGILNNRIMELLEMTL